MTSEMEGYRQDYNNWLKEYEPEFLEYDTEGGPNFLKAKSTPNEFIWTAHGTCEDDQVSAGFHFFGDPVRCCWDTYGWYISKVSSGNTSPDDYEVYRESFYGQCKCYNEETEEGKPDCETCDGDGWYTEYFD